MRELDEAGPAGTGLDGGPEHAGPGGEALVPLGPRRREPEERTQALPKPGSVHALRQDRIEPRLDRGDVIGVEDACMSLEDFAQRPERHALSVGEAAPLAPRDHLGMLIKAARKLKHEATLPDPRLAHDEDHLQFGQS